VNEKHPAFSGNEHEAELATHQLDLPLGAKHHARTGVWNGDSDWPSPQHVLATFLERIGTTQPNRVAGALLRDFNSLAGVLNASWWRLRRSVGVRVASAISGSRDLMRAALQEQVSKGPVVGSQRQVVELLQAHLGSLTRERLIAIYVDANLHLLRIQHISEGSKAETPLDIPKIIHCGLDVGAAGVLIVHNHPSGDARPSRADERATARLSRIAADLDMHVVDALIVAGGEVRSMLGRFKEKDS
jgi:DNA repair protein RadC